MKPLFTNLPQKTLWSRGGTVEAIKGLERLISIWTERNVYDATFLVKLHKCLGQYEWVNKFSVKESTVKPPISDHSNCQAEVVFMASGRLWEFRPYGVKILPPQHMVTAETDLSHVLIALFMWKVNFRENIVLSHRQSSTVSCTAQGMWI